MEAQGTCYDLIWDVCHILPGRKNLSQDSQPPGPD